MTLAGCYHGCLGLLILLGLEQECHKAPSFIHGIPQLHLCPSLALFTSKLHPLAGVSRSHQPVGTWPPQQDCCYGCDSWSRSGRPFTQIPCLMQNIQRTSSGEENLWPSSSCWQTSPISPMRDNGSCSPNIWRLTGFPHPRHLWGAITPLEWKRL